MTCIERLFRMLLTGCWQVPVATRGNRSPPVPLPGSGMAPCAETLMAFGSVWDTNMACSWDQTHSWDMGKQTQATVHYTGGGVSDSRDPPEGIMGNGVLLCPRQPEWSPPLGLCCLGRYRWLKAFPSNPPEDMGGSNNLGMLQWRSEVHTCRTTHCGWVKLKLWTLEISETVVAQRLQDKTKQTEKITHNKKRTRAWQWIQQVKKKWKQRGKIKKN